MDINTYYKKFGETDAKLSNKSGVPQPTIWRVRTGRVIPRYPTAARISEAIGGAISAAEIQQQAAEMAKARREQAAA